MASGFRDHQVAGRSGAEKDPRIGKASKNDHVMAEGEELSYRCRRISTGDKIRLVAVICIGCCLGLLWLRRDCSPSGGWNKDDKPSSTLEASGFGLVKYAAPAPAATSSVLEVFQVYQPVLTPSGVTGETTLGDGSENTTTIASVASGSYCEVVLMEHTFANSYGQPFVGMQCSISIFHTANPNRDVHPTQLQVQSSDNELYCHFSRKAV
jgi:hypothetical protein